MTPSELRSIFREELALFVKSFPYISDVRLFIRRKHFTPNASKRDIAWWSPENRTVNVIRAALSRSKGQLRGIIRHELGHAADLQDNPGHERRADDLAKKATGKPIRYTSRESLQHVTHGKPGRPHWLHQ